MNTKLRKTIVATAAALAAIGATALLIGCSGNANPSDRTPSSSAAATYYASCGDADKAGVTPMHKGQPGYRPGLDRDGDGVACDDQATPTPTKPTAAQEQAYFMEVVGQVPEFALARQEIVKAGYETCQAFRTKPGTVDGVVKKAKASGATAETVNNARVISIAAIHNLCIDQAEDLPAT